MGVSWSPADAVTFPTADGAWVVVSGDLDPDQLGRIRSDVLAATGAGGRLVIDLRRATFVGAAAIGLLNEVSERAPRAVAIVCSPSVRRVLALCGLESGPFEEDDADVLLDVVRPALFEPAPRSSAVDAF